MEVLELWKNNRNKQKKGGKLLKNTFKCDSKYRSELKHENYIESFLTCTNSNIFFGKCGQSERTPAKYAKHNIFKEYWIWLWRISTHSSSIILVQQKYRHAL